MSRSCTESDNALLTWIRGRCVHGYFRRTLGHGCNTGALTAAVLSNDTSFICPQMTQSSSRLGVDYRQCGRRTLGRGRLLSEGPGLGCSTSTVVPHRLDPNAVRMPCSVQHVRLSCPQRRLSSAAPAGLRRRLSAISCSAVRRPPRGGLLCWRHRRENAHARADVTSRSSDRARSLIVGSGDAEGKTSPPHAVSEHAS